VGERGKDFVFSSSFFHHHPFFPLLPVDYCIDTLATMKRDITKAITGKDLDEDYP